MTSPATVSERDLALERARRIIRDANAWGSVHTMIHDVPRPVFDGHDGEVHHYGLKPGCGEFWTREIDCGANVEVTLLTHEPPVREPERVAS